MGLLAGPGEVVVAAASAAVAGLSVVARSSSASAVAGSRTGWAAALGELQRVADVVAAAQDAVIVALAAIEEEWAEDGTVVESHRTAGHVALDAAAVVSGVLCLSAVQAERRVRSAVRLAGDGPSDSVAATGLAGLHAAMAAGRLDGYRASVVADELELAPAEVAGSVVAALEPFFDVEDAPALRRRCRRLVTRVSPELLRQRAVRARAESRLERWASEPGVDCWHGTFPSEEAARAWAAVDALAQRYLADGTCERVDRARAKALMDLVEGSATIETVVTLVVPHGQAPGNGVPPAGDPAPDDGDPMPGDGGPAPSAGGLAPGADPGSAADLVEVAGLRAGDPVLVGRAWLERAVAGTAVSGRNRVGRVAVTGRDRVGRVRLAAGDRATGALVDPVGELSGRTYRPGRRLAALVRTRDGRCRFPGCQVAARFCDLDHVRAWPGGPTAAVNLLCLCRRHHRVKQRPGWRVVLAADGVATWTDPTGRVRVTAPVDVLHPLVLPAGADERGRPEPEPAPGAATRLVLPGGPHSFLEHRVEHHLPGYWHRPAGRVDLARPPEGRWRHDGRPHRTGTRRGQTVRRVHRRGVPVPEEPPPF